ncbi:hypothetical protein BG011_007281 [Mortierella polycephala]|uniref:Uncharacterized protein n=1 Tax=Mortierella polycephala TaxID=41804 RepID=A0A9P6PQL1_9FUNG|nr:hypothetical protein BG011_007281 [Mortierella polycephala]
MFAFSLPNSQTSLSASRPISATASATTALPCCLPTTTASDTLPGQDAASFTLERFSRLNSTNTNSGSINSNGNSNKAHFGGAGPNLTDNTRSWSSTAGRYSSEAKEPSSWIHLSAPHHLVLVLLLRRAAQSGDPEGRPTLMIQSSQDILECVGLDGTSLRSSRLKGLVKGSMIGFQYNYFPHGSSAPEKRKFQVKFKSEADCGQCASILSRFIDNRTVSLPSDHEPNVLDATTSLNVPGPTSAPTTTIFTGIGAGAGTGTESSKSGNSGPNPPLLFSSQDFNQVFTQDVLGQQQQLSITPSVGSQPIPVVSASSLNPMSVQQQQQQPPLQTIPYNELDRLLITPDSVLQNEITSILQDPKFSERRIKLTFFLVANGA